MKKRLRIPFFLIIAIMLLALCGCAVYNAPTGAGGGIIFHDLGGASSTYSLYPQSMELIYNGAAYTYDISRSGDAITYTVYYPNGGKYYETRGGDAETSGWNEKYHIGTAYTSGEELVDLLSREYYISHPAPTVAHVLIALLFLALGGFHAFFPETAWYFSHALKAWQYKSIEPSSDGLTMTRVGGVITMVLGVILFFIKWS